jgi:hypothetical protein
MQTVLMLAESTECDRRKISFRHRVLDVQWLLSPLAILSGMLTVVQSACNGMLEKIGRSPSQSLASAPE